MSPTPEFCGSFLDWTRTTKEYMREIVAPRTFDCCEGHLVMSDYNKTAAIHHASWCKGPAK